MDLLDGGVTELFVEEVDECAPARISIARSGSVIFIVIGGYVPVGVAEVNPPVLGGSGFEEGGGENHHLGIEGEVLPKH